MSDLVPLRRALLSVSDKTGLKEFATALHTEFHVQLISTGGTAKFLRDASLPVTDVSEITGFPEMMDGRVKTLHPKIHGALLALRDNPHHLASAQQHQIDFIDLVCINLYPFEQTISKPNVTFEEAIENIDIGGPSMVRSAAKNHRFVLVVTSPERYDKVLGDLRQHNGSSCGKHRLKMAQQAFAHTAAYDAKIANYLANQVTSPSLPLSRYPGRGQGEGPSPATKNSTSPTNPPPLPYPGEGRGEGLPPLINLSLTKKQDLRYGENPHQQAALYQDSTPSDIPSVATAKQLHGKDLSYINLLDADAALAAVLELPTPSACIVKHATPCGYATASDLPTAFQKAYTGDPLAAFGGIAAVNQPLDESTAQTISEGQKFLEVIVAPSFAPEALELLRNRWKNVRLLELSDSRRLAAPRAGRAAPDHAQSLHLHKISGGYLIQQPDLLSLDPANWKVATSRHPTPDERSDHNHARIACKYVKSNAIVIAKDQMMIGSGAGQQDRVTACRIAIAKAADRAQGAVAASDAFFPFPDGPELLINAGVTAIIHPGGSVRDQESIDLANRHNVAVVLTGQRHFRH
jgi:phosphoribosylaminoimidazolecarboxamide formyltransferase/IMP cyclohydrolase